MAGSAGIELATVYVSLVPSLKGAPEEIGRQVSRAARSGPVRKAGLDLGDRLAESVGRAMSRSKALPKAVGDAASKAAAGASKSLSTVRQVAEQTRATVQRVGAAASEIKATMSGAAHYVGLSWQGVMGHVIPQWVQRAAKTVAGGMRAVQASVRGAVASVGAAWDGLKGRVAKAVAPVVGTVRSVMAAAGRSVRAGVAAVGQSVAGVVSKVTGPLSTVAARVGLAAEAARVVVAQKMTAVGRTVQAAAGRVAAPFQKAWSAAGAWAGQMVGPVRAAMSATGTVVSSAASRIGGALKSIVPPGVWNALTTGASKAASAMSSTLGRGVQAAARVVGNGAQAIGRTLSDGVQAGVNAAKAAIAGLGGAILSNLGGAVQRADMLNNFPKIMENIGYDADEARSQITRISDSLAGLPSKTQDVAGVAQGLAPLTGSLTEATDVALALNNALLAGGGDETLVANALEQYRQMLAVGTVDMAAWRSLTGAMPGQLNQVAEAMLGAGKNSNDLYEALKGGEVSFDDFNQALVDLNKDGVGELASFEEQARTATGGIGTAFSLVRTRITNALAGIIQAIGVDAISSKINELTSGISGVGKTVADAIKAFKDGGGLSSLAGDLGGLLPVGGAVVGVLGGMASSLPVVGGLFSGVTGPVGLLVGLLASAWSQSESLRTSVGELGKRLSDALASPAVAQAGQGLVDALGTVGKVLGDALAPVVDVLGSLVGPDVELLAAGLSAVLDVLTPVVEIIGGALTSALETIAPHVQDYVSTVAPLLIEGIGKLRDHLTPIFETLSNIVAAALPPLASAIGTVIEVLTPIVQAVLPVVIDVLGAILDVIGAVANVLMAVLAPAFQLAGALIEVAVQAIGAVFTWLWDNIIGPVVGWITDKLKGWSDWMNGTLAPFIAGAVESVKDVFQSLKDKAGAVADGVKQAFSNMKDGIKNVWDKVKEIAAKPVNFLINTVYTGGIKKLVNGITDKLGLGLRLPDIAPIGGYASGGVLPGYTPGRDVYHFTSTDGGGRLALSGGEAIMRPEWVRAVGGAPAVAAMNAAAKYGRPIPGGDLGRAAAFADGGIWGAVKGGVSHAWEWVKDAADAVASIISDPLGAVEHLVRAPVNALLGGVPGAGVFLDIAKAVPGKVIDSFGQWLKGKTASMGASDIVAAARTAIGVPYVWGGSSIPPGVDCSGLVYWAANKAGHRIPRLTAAGYQANAGGVANRNVPGNLLFWGNPAWHVAITSGGGRMIEAPNVGSTVREAAIWGSPSVRSYKFDQGGWLQPGFTPVVNETGRPEAVLTGGQWSKLDDLLDVLRENAERDLVVRDVDDALVGRMRTESLRQVVAERRANPRIL